ncbi:cob(I)yrinic acid a,c-diamide adenosyltransferase [Ferrimonas balearica]|uniref:cob(I)yrinic acid a,c-diamide adenosyltransferase n=1 Tax=Ferrimonas balearica TaxID=44012 RepID=UPI001C99E9AE|nr:cob(I)yrinic acid a,c-diamide adenosyltransferase [Ferrimonas balearica]MBY5992549.1 cob(I)yrinic acid a,c-diamide adenosyltransferase [Ferrimonas balearica]
MRDKEKHKARQQRLKAEVDAKVAQAQTEKGVLLVLTGNGKGKSTAGFGTVLRAVGHGLRCSVAQFIKGEWPCGERNVLSELGVAFHVMNTGFTWDTQDREADTRAAQAVWQAIAQDLANPAVDLVLLDELTYMLSFHYLEVDEVLTALANRPTHQHVVVTGRNCHRRLIEMADTVSDVTEVKHAFSVGVKAQKGLDW